MRFICERQEFKGAKSSWYSLGTRSDGVDNLAMTSIVEVYILRVGREKVKKRRGCNYWHCPSWCRRDYWSQDDPSVPRLFIDIRVLN